MTTLSIPSFRPSIFHPLTGGKNHKKNSVQDIVLAPLNALKKAFCYSWHTIDMAFKVTIYHCSLVYNVAMNQLFPNSWKWWNEIDPQIYLGAEPLSNKGHFKALTEMGFTLILSKLEDFEYSNGMLTKPVRPEQWESSQIHVWRSPTRDGTRINENQLNNDLIRMRQEILARGKIYVHCKAGRGRSAMTVIAYYMKYEGMTFDAAYAYVKSKRPQVFLTASQTRLLKRINFSAL